MASALYGTGKASLMSAGISLTADTIKAILVDTDNSDGTKKYVVNLTTDVHLSDIASAKRVSAAGVALTTKSDTLGVFDADDVTFPSLTSAQNVGAVVLYKDTGTESTSQLIAYIDTAAGLPMTPTGADCIIRWSNGVNKIFALV